MYYYVILGTNIANIYIQTQQSSNALVQEGEQGMAYRRRPEKYGLYDPAFEKDGCGVGFVANIKGVRSHSIIEDAKEVLINMTHRGAVGSEKNTGDGAGLLTALPWEFLEKVATENRFVLPDRGKYAAGIVFLSDDAGERQAQKKRFEELAGNLSLRLIAWRVVPRDNSMIGPTALASEPAMEMIFLAAPEGLAADAFERKLYVLRKLSTRTIRASACDKDSFFYVCSLSSRTLVYKGMFTPEQVFQYFPDLSDRDFKSHLAMIHSRFSTNTFPSWDRAHPFRYMSHNGEINTLRGNVNKVRGREDKLASPLFGEDIKKLLPLIEPDLSDSGTFDNVLELLVQSGRSLPEAVMMMIPEAWQNDELMSDEKRAFYEYSSCLMEPWDGPASIAFTDGKYIGAVLDRNGLRPSRYYITDDDRVIMASEVGVLPLATEAILSKGRLQPGKMFLVDFEKGRIVDDTEIKALICGRNPYRVWLSEQRLELSELDVLQESHGFYPETILERLKLFGYTFEHIRLILKVMADSGKEPLGSMGNDAALAVLSGKPRLLYDYFKQLFAQVTNPPIDSIREEVIMSLESYIGPERNLLETTPEHAHRLHMPSPFLTNEQLTVLKHLNHRGWKTKTVDITYPAEGEGPRGLLQCLDRICAEAEQAIADGYSVVILSDREAGPGKIPLSALLAVGAVHQHLVRKNKRTQIGLILESGEPREVHHFCMLVGFGADAVNPFLAYEVMWKMQRDGNVRKDLSDESIIENYIDALEKGMRKVFGKMGISTLESYKGAQIFEAVGLNAEIVDRCFAGTASRIQGADFSTLAAEAKERHETAYPKGNPPLGTDYMNPGDLAWRADGDKHMWDPESIANLQIAVRYERRDAYKAFVDRQNARSTEQATLRGLLKFKKREAIDISQVESIEDIVKRFVTGAMSFGSISKEAHETLAIAMNRLGGKSNTGEGGEDPERFKPLPNGDSKRSAIKQVASGRFGVTINYLTNADELQIKMAQGAKPGEGGELPGHKVFGEVAKTRHSTPGVGLISPPPHHDIYSIEDLAQLIFDLKNSNPKARISVKLVSEVGVGTVAAGVAKAHADHILISGHDGGTGASPLTGIKHAGLPWELGIAETHQTLVMNDLRKSRGPADGRPDQDRPRRGHSHHPRGRGDRLCHHGAHQPRLHHDAEVREEHLPRGHRDPGPEAPGQVRGKARIRDEALHLSRRGHPEAPCRTRFQEAHRPCRPGRPPGRGRGGPQLEVEGCRPFAAARSGPEEGRKDQGDLLQNPGPRNRRRPRPKTHRPCGTGAPGSGTPDHRGGHQEHGSGRRHHAQQPHHHPLGGRGPAGQDPAREAHGYGRPELRRLAHQGRDPRTRGRRERLRRKGPFRRKDRRVSAENRAVHPGGKHPHRKRGALRRNLGPGLLPGCRGRTVLRAELRRRGRHRRHRRPWLRIHDRRQGRHHRPDRKELRRRHERRHRLCLGR